MVPLTILKLSRSPWRSALRQLAARKVSDVVLGGIVHLLVDAQHGHVTGAEMMTFFTGPRICFLASLGIGEAPGGFDHHLRPNPLPRAGLAGSSAKTLMVLSPTEMLFCAEKLVGQIAQDRIVFQQAS